MILIAVSFLNEEDEKFGSFFIRHMPAVPREGEILWLDGTLNEGFDEQLVEEITEISWLVVKVAWGFSSGEYFGQLFLVRSPN